MGEDSQDLLGDVKPTCCNVGWNRNLTVDNQQTSDGTRLITTSGSEEKVHSKCGGCCPMCVDDGPMENSSKTSVEKYFVAPQYRAKVDGMYPNGTEILPSLAKMLLNLMVKDRDGRLD